MRMRSDIAVAMAMLAGVAAMGELPRAPKAEPVRNPKREAEREAEARGKRAKKAAKRARAAARHEAAQAAAILRDRIEPGDAVHHAPSGEDWVVMRVGPDWLEPAGWPPCRAKLADCRLLEKGTAQQRAEMEAAAKRREVSDA